MFHWISFSLIHSFIEYKLLSQTQIRITVFKFRIFNFQLYIDIWKLNFGTLSKESLNHQLIVELRTLHAEYRWVIFMSNVLNDEVPEEYVLEEYSECSISILIGADSSSDSRNFNIEKIDEYEKLTRYYKDTWPSTFKSSLDGAFAKSAIVRGFLEPRTGILFTSK